MSKCQETLIKQETKVAELSCKLRGHALAAYADRKHDLHYHASSMLQGLVIKQQLFDFLQQ